MSVGTSETVGSGKGTTVGTGSGMLEGRGEGLGRGSEVGFEVGKRVGGCVGEGIGTSVGAGIGNGEGTQDGAEGCDDGVAVGRGSGTVVGKGSGCGEGFVDGAEGTCDGGYDGSGDGIAISAQQRVRIPPADSFSHLEAGFVGFAAPGATEYPPGHAVLDHSISLSNLHPEFLASSISSIRHIRAPALSQNSLASDHVTSPLQPPRPKSLSPQTSELPNVSAFVHPKSWQLDVDCIIKTVGR